MKNKYSFWSTVFICIILALVRFYYLTERLNKPFDPIKWDAFGYYMYLPGTFIYGDLTHLEWLPEIEKEYGVSGGGEMYQAHKAENGNYVFKYLGGVSITQIPLFFIGHFIAKNSTYKADGFSLPYQISIVIGAVFYAILAIIILRKVLLVYYDDITTSITLLFALLATNFIQYVAVDNALSHAFIFPLYVLLIYFTMKWHQQPKIKWAVLGGLLIGLATICRPTEAISVLIPIFWDTHNKVASKQKWQLVKQYKNHIFLAVIFGFIGILPQLIYWKIASGSFVYDVGSKWSFLSPFFRVLIGWEKGWFIYTPITIFFVVGLFLLKGKPFRKSVLIFCLLNIYIVISWFIWRYGASYSTRALVQSYPVFILAFGAFIEYIKSKKWRYSFYLLGFYLIGLNIFQIWQYNTTILHSDDMNRKYYSRIYLNPSPSPLDMSLLDTKDWIQRENKYSKINIFYLDETIPIIQKANSSKIIQKIGFPGFYYPNSTKEQYLKIEYSLLIEKGIWGSSVVFIAGDKKTDFRILNAISKAGETNNYSFYFKLPNPINQPELIFAIKTNGEFKGELKKLKITCFYQ